jgi:hypothetical protein
MKSINNKTFDFYLNFRRHFDVSVGVTTYIVNNACMFNYFTLDSDKMIR